MSTYREQLVILVGLQRAEMEIISLENDLAGIDERIEALSSEVTEFETNVSDALEQLEAHKKQYRSDEQEIKSIDAQIEKSEEKLRAVKTNKEYQSTLKEIDDLREKVSGIEDLMLENLERIENADQQVTEQKADLEEVKIEVLSKQEEIRERGQAQQQALEKWRAKRERILAQIDSKMGELYSRVKKQNNGLAMAPVRDAVCELCRVNIPPQLYNELMRMDSTRICPHCQRIMYPKLIEEEIE